jgi:hypothetical protein
LQLKDKQRHIPCIDNGVYIARGAPFLNEELKMKNEKRVFEKGRSGENQLGERPSGKGREHPPRRTISLLSDFFVNCLN